MVDWRPELEGKCSLLHERNAKERMLEKQEGEAEMIAEFSDRPECKQMDTHTPSMQVTVGSLMASVQ